MIFVSKVCGINHERYYVNQLLESFNFSATVNSNQTLKSSFRASERSLIQNPSVHFNQTNHDY